PRPERQGFTIIELIIVVIVIGILAAAGMGKYQNFAEMARTRGCCANIKTVEMGIAVWTHQNTEFSEAAEGWCFFGPRTGVVIQTGGPNNGGNAVVFGP